MYGNTFLYRFIKSFVTYVFILLLFISIGLGYGLYNQRQVYRESQRFINTLMLTLLADWNNDLFLSQLSPELYKNTTAKQMQTLQQILSKLGELANYHGSQGKLFRSHRFWWQVIGRYHVYASFQNGLFAVQITVFKINGEWKIEQFEYEYWLQPLPQRFNSIIIV